MRQVRNGGRDMEKTAAMAFKGDHAANYDKNWQKLLPFKQSLHLAMQLVLRDLPEEAHILCVGVGTGSELLALADAFPTWYFTAVEPSGEMLAQCVAAATRADIANQCHFHEGYVNELEDSRRFDAATSILVSQFLLEPEDRRDFYRSIASRLKPDGLLISADLSAEKQGDSYGPLFGVWANMIAHTGAPTQDREKMLANFGRDVTVAPQAEIEAIIASAGFDDPTLFHKTLFINATFARQKGQRTQG